MYELCVTGRFSSAHHMEGYQGKCAAHHGHNWEVKLYVRGRDLDKTGLLTDFSRLRETAQRVLERMDHKDLNLLEPFRRRNPSCENIAQYLYGEFSAALNGERVTVHRVAVSGGPGGEAVFWVEKGGEASGD